MSLDVVHPNPSPQMREWAAAQAYILERDNIVDEMRQEAAQNNEPFKEPQFQESGVQDAYDHITETLKSSGKINTDVTCNNLLEDLLHEKSFDLNRFTTDQNDQATSARAKFSPEGIQS